MLYKVLALIASPELWMNIRMATKYLQQKSVLGKYFNLVFTLLLFEAFAAGR